MGWTTMKTTCTICARHGIETPAAVTRDIDSVSGYPARVGAPLCAECAEAMGAPVTPAEALAGYTLCGEAELDTLRSYGSTADVVAADAPADEVAAAYLCTDGQDGRLTVRDAANRPGDWVGQDHLDQYEESREREPDRWSRELTANDFDAAVAALMGAEAWALRDEAATVGGVVRWHRPSRRPVVAVKVAGRWMAKL
jgi:hypothetical protein